MRVSLRGVSLLVSRMLLPSFVCFFTQKLGGGLKPHKPPLPMPLYCSVVWKPIHVTTSVFQVSYLKVLYARARNRLNFQILAYLLTIDLLYDTRCLPY